MVRVTIAQWVASTPQELIQEVENLKDYLLEQPADILLLPELPFSDWFPSLKDFDNDRWDEAEITHLHWIDRLETFGVPTIIGTRPKTGEDGTRYNSSCCWP